MALAELYFVMVLSYQAEPQTKDFVRIDMETADACLDAVANLVSAEDEYPVRPENTIKWAFCVDRRNLKPILEYRISLETP